MIQQISEYKEITEQDITKARHESDKKINGLTSDQIRALRIKCKYDLFFLATGPLGYDKLSVNLHGSFCRWLERNKYEQYRIKLLPRSHFKTTVDTITDSIQLALPDDLGNALYPHNLGSNIRILLAHDVAEMAQRFLYSITQHFTINPILIGLFPELIPNPRLQRINKSELELPRQAIWSEPTFDTMGVGGRGQGRHYNKLKLDDIYGEAARDSKTEREGHIQWFDNIQAFLLTPKTDHIDISGTRWAFDDVYAHAMKTYGKQMVKYIRSVVERDKDGVLQPIFPEQFSLESLEILKKNKKVWNAQYINDPKEGSAAWQPEWLRFYNKVGRNLQIFTSPSPFNDGGSEDISFEELDRIILIDPAMKGLTGFVVTGTDRKKRNFILEATKKAFKTEELRDHLFSAVIKWQPRVVVIEEVLFSAIYEPWFRAEMKLRGLKFNIELARTRQVEKALRVHGLTKYYQDGEIYCHADQSDFIEEYNQFGATDDYHLHDALAYGPRFWKPGNRNYNVKLDLPAIVRDPITGYSEIKTSSSGW